MPRPWLLLAPLLLALAPRSAAQEVPAELRDRVVEHRLENGWRFLLLPRADAPTIAFETWVDSGAATDPDGASGLANLTKNLLFKGSDRVGTLDWEAEEAALSAVEQARQELDRLEQEDAPTAEALATALRRLEAARTRAASLVDSEAYSRILEDAGGGSTLNAFLDQDGTRFVVSLPANQLELWCWMESERFRRPVLREFAAELDALLEDGRARFLDAPEGRLERALREAAFGPHPLGRPAFGDLEELAELTRAQVRGFIAERYGARRCTTAIVGDFDPSRLVPMLERYFGPLPAGPARRASVPPPPPADGERRVRLAPGSPSLLWMAWRVPPAGHPDAAAVEVAVRLLGYARSSRLERRLVRDGAMCSELSVAPAWGGRRGASLALLQLVPLLGVELDSIEEAVDEELARLRDEGPTREELDGVRRIASAEHYRALRSNSAIAAGLASSFGRSGDWRAWFSSERRLSAVTGREVQRAVATYFVPERRVVASQEPEEEPRPDAEAQEDRR